MDALVSASSAAIGAAKPPLSPAEEATFQTFKEERRIRHQADPEKARRS
ncbi:hypothetical protein [Bradyrhizobium australiense]|uniref:Uncharacterized protein n=1 Tax=Bradyrhizobium australiense TaxID=2721161 RepID=A0A7Y4GSP6_9BRAD|nr:hypothetical protein [Bradyrhizobium australiense]NOJ41136.1 hypothetical protein [Bradyrhizobium australiense]